MISNFSLMLFISMLKGRKLAFQGVLLGHLQKGHETENYSWSLSLWQVWQEFRRRHNKIKRLFPTWQPCQMNDHKLLLIGGN